MNRKNIKRVLNKSPAVNENQKDFPRFLIGGTSSGAGKTTVTLGIMAAFKKRGLSVQGFKCGPDYIDPGYHCAVTERISHNLDSWFVKPSIVRQIFFNNSFDADISIIEGVMGLYDGRSPSDDQGSSADISQILHAPVVLVLDARSMARSAAAIVKGFQLFSKKIQIAGVIANKVGSKNHLGILREAIEKECKIPLVGGILRDEKLKIPERHLGLLPAIERGELNSIFKYFADTVEDSLDLEMLLHLAGVDQKSLADKNLKKENKKSIRPYALTKHENVIKVAVARDAAFNFYYPESLQVMQQSGMELVYFSPLKNEPVPDDCSGLYLGGGFPEEFAGILSTNLITKKSVIAAIENGMPTVAECGGFMYLTKEIVDRNGKKYLMAGVLSGSVVMQARLVALGYREIIGLKNNFLLHEDENIRGHEFHYSSHSLANAEHITEQFSPAYHLKGRNIDSKSGFIYKNLIAGYVHFYFLSNPAVVKRWIRKCIEYKSLFKNT